MSFQNNNKDLSDVEIYKYRLGSTAARECEPLSLLQAKYMTSDYPVLDMDSDSAYFTLLGMISPNELYMSMFGTDEDVSEIFDPHFYIDGVANEAPKCDKVCVPQKQNLRRAIREVDSMNLVEREFSMSELDIGERILLFKEVKVITPVEVVPCEVSIVGGRLSYPFDLPLVDVTNVEDELMQQYVDQVDYGEDNGICLYQPGVPTTLDYEEIMEALDILNLCSRLGYKCVSLPSYMSLMKPVLIRSGLICGDENANGQPVLYWRGRHYKELLVGEAGYVELSSLVKSRRYYPSVLYGRGYSIQFTGVTTSLVVGIPGAEMSSRVITNLRNMIGSKVLSCVFYRDLYRGYFQVPLKVKGHRTNITLLPRDKRKKFRRILSNSRVRRLYTSMLYRLSQCDVASWDDGFRRNRFANVKLMWLMLVPSARVIYNQIRRIVEIDEAESAPTPRRSSYQ
jgi:hypothetical protein